MTTKRINFVNALKWITERWTAIVDYAECIEDSTCVEDYVNDDGYDEPW